MVINGEKIILTVGSWSNINIHDEGFVSYCKYRVETACHGIQFKIASALALFNL